MNTVQRAAESQEVERLARLGLVGRGVVYVLVAMLAAQIALGSGGSADASQQGAFRALAGTTFGLVVLWLVVVGFFGYGFEQGGEAVGGHRREQGNKRTAKRAESAAKAVLYVALGVSAARIVTGGGSGGGSEALTARVLGMTAGRYLVGAAGLVVVAVALGMAWRGLRTKFEEQLDLSRLRPDLRRGVIRLGQVGYLARGVVFAVLGLLVVAAAITFDPDKARGLDAALQELAGQPYGTWLLLLVALGLVCFGVYSFAEARYRRF